MNKVRNNNYSSRIMALIDWIKPGSTVIDVGTDHAYLPIALMKFQKNYIGKIIAIDSKVKPLEKAARNIKKAGLDKQISLKLNDGLKDIPLVGDETIIVAGLGGMLISQILNQAKNCFSIKNNFILQPNWTWYELRMWLAENGFAIVKEKVIADQDKYYSILLVKFTGETYTISNTEAFCGLNHTINEASTLEQKKAYYQYLLRLQRIAKKKARGISFYQDIYQDIGIKLEEVIRKNGGYFD
ncbi:MAG TPA: class I SAM-dependent methyltransferase [Candidatus Eisenbacteria bacterium]|nr:class I SAM-dependent methyltransferase [Candidatus Eisenbacteria bacterium]